MTNRLAIFDCDGTLVDSQHNICTAMDRAFEAVKLAPPPRHRTLAVVGLSLPEAMAVLLPEAEADFHLHVAEQYKLTFQVMRGRGLVQEPLYAGMGELVERLDKEGWLLGVATGKSDKGLQICLSYHGLVEKFVTLQTADRHPSKPHPSMIAQAMSDAGAAQETTVMIGDTSFDMEMAVNAGTRGLGVGWGYHSPQELIASGALSVAVDADELYRHITRHD